MNDLQTLIDKCRKHGTATLRGCWPGRGAAVTERRAKVKTLFGERQTVEEDKIVDGETVRETVATIIYDKQKGIFQLG